jgi:hypothetical protein
MDDLSDLGGDDGLVGVLELVRKLDRTQAGLLEDAVRAYVALDEQGETVEGELVRDELYRTFVEIERARRDENCPSETPDILRVLNKEVGKYLPELVAAVLWDEIERDPPDYGRVGKMGLVLPRVRVADELLDDLKTALRGRRREVSRSVLHLATEAGIGKERVRDELRSRFGLELR